MDFNIEIRKNQLDNLNQLISASEDRIEAVLHYLGWSKESVEKEDNQIPCPINGHHKIGKSNWNNHVEECLIKAEGYDVKGQFLSEPPEYNTAQSIYLDRNKKIEIITKEFSAQVPLRLAWNGLDPDPRTSDRFISTFSPDERLLFYNYAVTNTTGPAEPPEFTTISSKTNEDKPPTFEELLTQERDLKRRRVKYKTVSLNRKNHTEVLREVINGQMEEYAEWLKSKQIQSKIKHNDNGDISDKKEDLERPNSSISRNSNSSSSRSTHRKHERRRESRDRYKSRHKSRRRSHSRTRRHSSRDRRSRRH